jgi:hypothetical protein
MFRTLEALLSLPELTGDRICVAELISTHFVVSVPVEKVYSPNV